MEIKNAISPTRKEDYPQWYQKVIIAADLAENAPVRGCMVIKPCGYAIWEKIQSHLDAKFKETGHQNVYFPLLIPLRFLQQEAEHIEGFAKECAVVTHHRLEADQNGQLQPAGPLEEPYIIRPTSETIFGLHYAKWIKSYRDLPLKLNQWVNVMRWEMRTRLFLRTSEFLWQEGHTAHATQSEAEAETQQMLDIYANFIENVLAMPVIKGEKTERERFPGAVHTYTVEAMMQDCKALQAGTSHFLGQTFSKSFDIKFTDKNERLEHVWTTSWGLSTRIIGGLIMTHSDDNGLVLPPKIAPVQVLILPIYRKEQEQASIKDYCAQLKKQIADLYYEHERIRIDLDERELHGGEKYWQAIKKGIPLIIEVGARDMAAKQVYLTRRDQIGKKISFALGDFIAGLPVLLQEMQSKLYQQALQFQKDHTQFFTDLEQFKAYFADENNSGFAIVFSSDDASIEPILNELKISARCIPLETFHESGTCIFTGKPAAKKTIYARAY